MKADILNTRHSHNLGTIVHFNRTIIELVDEASGLIICELPAVLPHLIESNTADEPMREAGGASAEQPRLGTARLDG